MSSARQVLSKPGSNGRVADLGAGSGELSQFLPDGTLCVEVNPRRVAAGQAAFPGGAWINQDVTSAQFVSEVLSDAEPFTAIVSNPRTWRGKFFGGHSCVERMQAYVSVSITCPQRTSSHTPFCTSER